MLTQRVLQQITMTTIKTNKSIFSIPADILVNPVNCVGVSGAGLALLFKNTYPKQQEKYKEACSQKKLSIGNIFKVPGNPEIWYIPTKKHWKNPSKFSYIYSAVNSVRQELAYPAYYNKSIAIPLLETGLGMQNPTKVLSLLEKELEHLQNNIYISLYGNEQLAA